MHQQAICTKAKEIQRPSRLWNVDILKGFTSNKYVIVLENLFCSIGQLNTKCVNLDGV